MSFSSPSGVVRNWSELLVTSNGVTFSFWWLGWLVTEADRVSSVEKQGLRLEKDFLQLYTQDELANIVALYKSVMITKQHSAEAAIYIYKRL